MWFKSVVYHAPPGHITFFSRKIGDNPGVGHTYSVMTRGSGKEQRVITPRVGTATVGDNPGVGVVFSSDNPGVGHGRRVMSHPIPGGGMVNHRFEPHISGPWDVQ